MSKMKELSMVLDELVTCGETLIKTANALRDIYSNTAGEPEPASGPAPAQKSAKKTSAKTKPIADAPAPEPESTSAASELTPESETPTPSKTYTKEDVRGILAAKSSAGHADEVRALLAKFGAKQLKQVDPKDYAALVKEAEEIGGNADA